MHPIIKNLIHRLKDRGFNPPASQVRALRAGADYDVDLTRIRRFIGVKIRVIFAAIKKIPPKKLIKTSGIVLAIFVLLFFLGKTTLGKRLYFPAWFYDSVRELMGSDPILPASDYKDGTILLIKPVATGAGPGRYEAGDIVEIRDGQEMYERFGNGSFLGKEERTMLLPVYYPKKLTEEQKKQLLASDNNNAEAKKEMMASESQSVKLKTDGTAVIASEHAKAGERGNLESALSRPGIATSSLDKLGTSRNDNQKMFRRRSVGVDYTKFLTGYEVLKVRQYKKLEKLPVIDLSSVIDKKSGLSIYNFEFRISNQILISNVSKLIQSKFNQNSPRPELGTKAKLIIRNSDSVVHLPKYLEKLENGINTAKKIAELIIPETRAATESVKIVDPGGGSGYDYLSLNTWEGTQQRDITAATGNDTIAVAKCRSTGGVGDTDYFTIYGWTTGPDNYIKIWTDPAEPYRHNGVWDETKYHMDVTLPALGDTISVEEDHVIIDGLQISVSAPSGGGVIDPWQNLSASADISISNNIIKEKDGETADGMLVGIQMYVSGITVRAWNNIIYNFSNNSAAESVYGIYNYAGTLYAWNNTIHDLTATSRGVIGIFTSTGGTVYAWGNIIYNLTNSSASYDGVGIALITGSTGYLRNNIIYNITNNSTFTATGISTYSGATTYIYNNTVYNCHSSGSWGIGIYLGSETSHSVIKNNIVVNADSYCYYHWDAGGGDNFSGDNDLAYQCGCTNLPGSNSRCDVPVLFADAANGDLRLAYADTGAKGYGANLTTDPDGYLSFSDDIDGQTRPATGVWDIGADEYQAIPIYRSVGPSNTTALASSTGATLTISGETAAFNAALPNRIGVGDVIVYNGAGGTGKNSVAFINGRTDSLNYSVQPVDGRGYASSTYASTNWQIFRAYTSLANAESGDENDGLPDDLEEFESWTNGKNLASTTETWNVAAYGDAADTAAVTIDGWTTTAGDYINIYTPYLTSEVGVSQRHQGVWDDSKYKLQSAANNDNLLLISDENVRVDGLQFYSTGVGGYNQLEMRYATGVSNYYVSDNIIKIDATNTNQPYGILLLGAGEANSTAYIWNNILYNYAGNASDIAVFINDSDFTTYIYNNTIYNSSIGIDASLGTVIAKNNLIASTTDPFNETFAAGTDYNATDINDTPGVGSNNRVNQVFGFADKLNNDFHLAANDTGALGYGENLLTGGLVGHWAMDEDPAEDGTEIVDSSGSGNNGTLNTGDGLNKSVGGKVGQAVNFDGVDDRVALSGPTVSNTFTFTAWFKVTSYPDGWGTLIAQDNNSGIFVTNDNKISYYYSSYDHKNTNSFNQEQWNHVAVVNEGGNAIFYINGVADGGCGSAPGFTVGYIGKDNSSNDNFNGLIDEVRIYNRALTGWEVANLYNNSSYSDDIDGEARPATGAWDIGADQMVARNIYRSVGPSKTDALASSTGATMTIENNAATFSEGLANNIGVGDVVVYDANGTSIKNSVAFINGRTSALVYSVQPTNGRGNASSTYLSTNWQIFRAYTSLANAVGSTVGGTENSGIPSALSDFDAWGSSHGKNLASTTEVWNVAAYGDAVDTTSVKVDGWTTTADNYINIYTPYLTSEVGASQRHSGVWDNSKYSMDISYNGLQIVSDNTRLIGIQVRAVSDPVINSSGINVTIDKFIVNGDNIGNRVLYVSGGLARITNSIVYNAAKGISSDWNASNPTVYAYNNTAYGCTNGIARDNAVSFIVKNNISYNNTVDYSGTFDSASTNNLSKDGTAPAYGTSYPGATVNFVSTTPGSEDFHLASTDTGARENGVNPFTDGLVGYWTFDEGTGIQANDSSGNGNTGTLSGIHGGKPNWTGGKFGNALSFDGVDNYVDGGSGSSLAITGALTVSAWVEAGQSVDLARIVQRSNSDSNGFSLRTYLNKFEFQSKRYSDTANAVADGNFALNQWYHVVGVYDGANISLYINGAVQSGSFSDSAEDSGLANLEIGRKVGEDLYYFNGSIDDVRIYNRALSAGEVAALYSNWSFSDDIDGDTRPQFTLWDIGADESTGGGETAAVSTQIGKAQTNLLTSGLVGYWSFNGEDMDWASQSAYDRSGSYATGTITNMSTTTSPTGGISGQALKFDGVDDYVILPDNAYSTLSSGTISAWVKLSSLASNYSIWGTKVGTDSYNVLGLFWSSTYGFAFYIKDSSTALLLQESGTSGFSANSWYHIVVTVGAAGNKMYINGQEQDLTYGTGNSSTQAFFNSLLSSTQLNFIGVEYYGGAYGQYMNGLLDEVRVYDRVLSESEILQLYQAGAAEARVNTPITNRAAQSGLVGNWSFNGPDIDWSSNTVYDRSGSNNNGTITNMSQKTSVKGGINGQALEFDGVDDYFETDLANNLMDSYQAGAVSAWVKTSVSGTGDFLAYANSTDVDSANSEWEVSNGVPAFEFQCSGWGRTYGSITVNDNKWHHIVFSADGTNPVKIYVDGVLDSTNYSGACGDNTYWTADILNIGSYNNYIDIGTLRRKTGLNDQFPGLIDEVRVYNRALSVPEIQGLYQAGLNGAEFREE